MTTVESLTEEYDRHWEQAAEEHGHQYIPEKYQLGIVADYLRERGMTYTTEAQVFHYPIDILAVDDKQTVAIELKSRNVSRGIEQALRDADLVERSYLAVWDNRVTEQLIDDINEQPIGLLGVDEDVTMYSEAEPTTKQLCSDNHIVGLW